MSKLLALGLSLADVVRAVTATPAKMLHLDERGFGALTVGAPAHVTIFDVRDETRELEDAEGEKRMVKQWIVPRGVFVDGTLPRTQRGALTWTRAPIYRRFGLDTVINAAGKMTALGGTAQSDGIARAQADAARSHVDIETLRRRAGELVAHYTGAEAA